MSKDTSGPAFPRRDEQGDGSCIQYFGLSKREYFAAMAMQALITRDKFRVGVDQPTWTAQCKLDAFLMADNCKGATPLFHRKDYK